jgi:hypothetical protein
LAARLAGRNPAVNLGALNMLTCAAFSSHFTQPLLFRNNPAGISPESPSFALNQS